MQVELLQEEQVLIVAFHSDAIPLDPFFLEVCERERGSVCVCVRERERDRACKRERERERCCR